MLIVLCGLPGTGKSTVAKLIVRSTGATFLRIDTIEQALRRANPGALAVGVEGYAVGYALAAENLMLGRTVVAECVNPLAVTRDAWSKAASRAGAKLLNVELSCSDAALHRMRVESRTVDVPGLALPTWNDVMSRNYEPWTQPHLAMDTAMLPAEETAAKIMEEMRRLSS